MSAKFKFLLFCLISGLLVVGVSWFGAIRLGLDVGISAPLFYIGVLLINLALVVGVISIIGFKRFLKWMYFIFVISLVVSVIVLAPFVDYLSLAVLGILCIIFVLTLIPIFKAHK